jgi:hypothetical protein
VKIRFRIISPLGELLISADGGRINQQQGCTTPAYLSNKYCEELYCRTLPIAGDQEDLIFDASGNLYGTRVCGGNANNDEHFGSGTAFKLSLNGPVAWIETALYQFCNNPNVCSMTLPTTPR